MPKSLTKSFFLLIFFLICLSKLVVNSHAQPSEVDYFNLSLHELANLPVINSLARNKQSLFESASASYLITQEAIKQSGATSIAELLRMVPGFHVGQIDGNMWSINSRSPNTRFSNELLVMIDGRNVFNPLFNGVYWNRVDTLLEDIDRIEVIRGPGSSLWGTNASNGIINIVTKSSAQTQGLLLNASLGSNQFDEEYSARYGFSGDKHDSRVYVKSKSTNNSSFSRLEEQSSAKYPADQTANDGSHFQQTGFKSDVYLTDHNLLTLQGDYYKGRENQTNSSVQNTHTDITGHNFLIRYHHELGNQSTYTTHLYYDYIEAIGTYLTDKRSTYDFDFQNNLNFSSHQFIWGFGLRHEYNQTKNIGHDGRLALSPENRTDLTKSLFFQDKIELIDETFWISLGTKFEKNDYTDYEYQPNIKLSYKPNSNQFFWASLSKAVSVPSRISADGYLDFNDFNNNCFTQFGFTDDPQLGCVIFINQSDLEVNILYAKELGYRQLFSPSLSIDTTLFMHDYRINNTGETNNTDYIWGFESALSYQYSKNWTLQGAWTYHRGQNNNTMQPLENVPRNRVFISSYYAINENLDLGVSYYYNSHTEVQDRQHRVDVRLTYRPTKQIELSLIGRNLFDPQHTEGNFDVLRANTNIERTFIGKISYKYD